MSAVTSLQFSTVSIANMTLEMNQLGSVGWEVVGFASSDKTIGLSALTAILIKRERTRFDSPDDQAPGWKRDPLDRHQLRWWHGLRWTSAVHDDGKNGTDWPLP